MIGPLHWLTVTTMVALSVAMSACATTDHTRASAKLGDSSVVAVVNTEAITLAELQESVATRRAEVPQGRPSTSEEALNQLISFRLQLQEAERDNITVDDAELANELNKRIKRYGLKDQEEFDRVIRAQGIALESVKRRLRESLQVQKLLRRNVGLGVTVTQDEVTSYLEENRDKLEVGLGYRGRQIVLVPDADTEIDREVARLRASKIHKELALGADFSTLAREARRTIV